MRPLVIAIAAVIIVGLVMIALKFKPQKIPQPEKPTEATMTEEQAIEELEKELEESVENITIEDVEQSLLEISG